MERDQNDGAFVIGIEMAAALAAEGQHRVRANAPSPLVDVRYVSPEELQLFHLVPAEADNAVRSLVDQLWADPGTMDDLRASLTMDDFYLLLTYTRRTAVQSLRAQNTSDVRSGIIALALVDAVRVDWRDVSWAAAIAAYVVEKIDGSAEQIFGQASEFATDETSQILRRFSRKPPRDLQEWGYREVNTEDGPGLIESESATYEPTLDLVSVTEALTAGWLDHEWTLSVPTVAVELPRVWFQAAKSRLTSRLFDRVRGCVSVRGIASPDMPDGASQMMLIFIGEAKDQRAAEKISNSVRTDSKSFFVGFGVSEANTFGVLIARSFVQDQPSFETSDSVQRFRSALSSALRTARSI